tara:strand:+ start:7388 stop:8005 length:618 start_codon:yes stop_codon:yes gene_type:complete
MLYLSSRVVYSIPPTESGTPTNFIKTTEAIAYSLTPEGSTESVENNKGVEKTVNIENQEDRFGGRWVRTLDLNASGEVVGGSRFFYTELASDSSGGSRSSRVIRLVLTSKDDGHSLFITIKDADNEEDMFEEGEVLDMIIRMGDSAKVIPLKVVDGRAISNLDGVKELEEVFLLRGDGECLIRTTKGEEKSINVKITTPNDMKLR